MSEAVHEQGGGQERPSVPITRVQKLALWGMGLIWVAAILGQIFVWGFLDHPLENAIRNLVTVSMGIALTVLTLAWWILLAPVTRTIRWRIAIPVLALLAGFLGSIRGIDMSGDMFPDISFRWEETAQERLERFRKEQATASPDVPFEALPAETPEDMPAFRGINRDGLVTGPPILQDWTSTGPKELWRRPCGGGYSSIAIRGDRAITLEQRRDQEAVVCYHLETGQELWVHEYPAQFIEFAGGPGPRSTPTIDGNSVYTVGALGDVRCLELPSGRLRWSKNMLKDLSLPNATWAMTSSPLIVDNKVVVNPGGKNGNGLLAYDKMTGEMIWRGAGLDITASMPEDVPTTSTPTDGHGQQGNAAAGYSSPMLVTIQGVRQILNFDGVGLHGNDPETGIELWFFPSKNDPLVNTAQPIVLDDGKILISASYGSGAKLVQVTKTDDQWSVAEVWANQNLKAKFSSNLLLDGHVYGLDEGIMVCLNPSTGERLWKGGQTPLRGRYSHGQILAADGRILVVTEKGQLVLVEPSPEKLIERGHVQAVSGAKVWNPFAMAHGRVLIRNAEEIVCYDVRRSSAGSPEAVAGK